MNPIIEQYQKQFAHFSGAERAFAFWKGRVALYALLRAPFNIDVGLLEEKVTARTKVIIAQHTYGYPCDMGPITDIARRHGVSVIEDCCLALGSKYKGRTVGTLGRAGYFSFQWNKPYTTGLGGMVITSDKELAGRIETLQADQMCSASRREIFMLSAQLLIYRLFVYPRTTAFAQSLFRYLTRKGAVVGSSNRSELEPSRAEDFFKGGSVMQARSGLRQLRKIEHNISHRTDMARLYDELLQSKGYKSRGYDKTVMTPVMVRYPVRITEKQKALGEAAKAGIELGSWFECPLHPIETPLTAYDYTIGMCPEAEKASREVVNLPLHPRADAGTVKKSADFITGFSQAG
ncbi:MAG: DegT/DnrJ/EryC1/StrS family aminotransferase [Planctomycetota bacterium]|jgi:dTDP-4-amino-4,6-dideoxygalactose transaminase